MSDYTQAEVLQAAELVALDDAALAAELAQLQATAQAAGTPEDDLSEAGYARLYALQAEQARRSPTCGLCGRVGVLSPGRTICPSCAYWPLD